MRFVKFLEENAEPSYARRYIDYSGLSENIRRAANSNDCITASTAFFEEYDANFHRVFNFIQLKYEEMKLAMGSIEIQILEKRKSALVNLENLLHEMTTFAEFIRINTEGFKRILRKFSRRTGVHVSKEYKNKLKKKLRDIAGLNEIIYGVSRLKLKTTTQEKAVESKTTFVRKTTKYWIHNENLTAIRTQIAKHLPIYVFTNNTKNGTPYSGWDFQSHDTCISSVYFDNTNFTLYSGRIRKLLGAEAIRIRWYGSVVPEVVFVERKRHEDSWTGERSKKLRFKIYEKDVVDYINGHDIWHRVKELNGEEAKQLYQEIQTAIMNKGLRPMVRTFYKRSAFQLPNNSRVRISLDTHLAMIKECPLKINEEAIFPITEWRRQDAICEWPFRNLPESDVVLFPHAILEIKTQGLDETKPEWIEKLLASSYAEHVHKFSKYMHGCATLFSNLPTIPYWLPQMKTDIRKDPYHGQKPKKMLVGKDLIYVPGESDATTSENLSPVTNHGKKIAMPGRVEPKIHFANERTFLKWIKFAIFLGGVGTTLLTIGDVNALVLGILLTAVAMVFGLYALYLWSWRVQRIYTYDLNPYDDRYGPIGLVSMYIAVMVIIVCLKLVWISKSDWQAEE